MKTTLGQTLGDFKKSLDLLTPTTKAWLSATAIRQILFEFDNKNAIKGDDVFHFIGYIPVDGRIYELEGLKEGPNDHGPIGERKNWLDVLKLIIEKRIQKYSAGEIHFNLMAVCSDR